MNSVKIIINDIEKDMYNDFGLSLRPRTRKLPPIKSLKTSIYGRSGDLDFTEALTGQTEYENRTETLEFNLVDKMSNWDSKFSEVSNFIHGQEAKVIFTSDSNYYFKGRLTMNELSSDKSLGTIDIDCDFQPYKYKLNETNKFFTYKGVALLDVDGNEVKLRKINDEVKDSIVYYNEKWCIAKNVGEVVFDGNVIFYYHNDYSTETKACFGTSYGVFDGVGVSSETIQSLDMINTHFNIVSRVWGKDEVGACIQVNTNGARIWIKLDRSIANSNEEIKSFFTNNPLTIQYKLDTTEYIELSSDIQTLLSGLDTSYTIDGYSLQNGTPTPLKPIPIYSFGDLGVLMLVNNELVDKLTLTNDRKRVVPTIKLSSEATLIFDGYSKSVSAGTYIMSDFVLNYGDNYIGVIGDGYINFNYKEASL